MAKITKLEEQKIKIKQFESMIEWFESVYQGKPIEIDLKHENGDYRCTILFFKKTNLKDLIENQKYKNYYFGKHG